MQSVWKPRDHTIDFHILKYLTSVLLNKFHISHIGNMRLDIFNWAIIQGNYRRISDTITSDIDWNICSQILARIIFLGMIVYFQWFFQMPYFQPTFSCWWFEVLHSCLNYFFHPVGKDFLRFLSCSLFW